MPAGDEKLAWLDKGIYRFMFHVSVKDAVAEAEHLLYEVKSIDRSALSAEALSAEERLITAHKCVTGSALELWQSASVWQLFWQLLMRHTVRDMLECCQVLHQAMAQQQTAAAHTQLPPAAPAAPAVPHPSAHDYEQACGGLHRALPSGVRVVRWGELAVGQPLGSGSYGTVFAARYKGLQVAVKCLEMLAQEEDWGMGVQQQLDQQQQQDQQQRLVDTMLKEATMLAENPHTHVVQCIAVCYEPPAIIMEFCKSGPLKHQLRHSHQLTPIRVLALLHEVAAAMHYLHTSEERSVLHCDLRALNLLLAGNSQRPEDWVMKVADFGLAQWVGEDKETALAAAVTNPLWVPPEVLEGWDDEAACYRVSKAADVYAFGAVMWEVLTGKVPYDTDSLTPWELEVLQCTNPCARIGPLKWPNSQQLLPGFDCALLQQLKPLFQACTSPEAKDRPPFRQIEQDLAVILQRCGAGVARAADAAPKVAQQGRDQSFVASVCASAAAALLSVMPQAVEPKHQASLQQQWTPFAVVGAQRQLAAGVTSLVSPFAAQHSRLLAADSHSRRL